MGPYLIKHMNAAAAQTPAIVSQQIYKSSQQGDPTAFLLWHATPGFAEDHDPGRVLLLHSVSHYASRMGRPASKWDDRTFANRGGVSYGTAPLAVWDTTYLHLAPAVYVPRATDIYTSLAGDPNVTLLGPYGAGYTGVKIIRCRKTLYVLAPYVGLLRTAFAEQSSTLRQRLPVGPLWNGCVPRSSDLAPIHIPRSWSPTPQCPYPMLSSSITATGSSLASCPASTLASTARREPASQKRLGR